MRSLSWGKGLTLGLSAGPKAGRAGARSWSGLGNQESSSQSCQASAAPAPPPSQMAQAAFKVGGGGSDPGQPLGLTE